MLSHACIVSENERLRFGKRECTYSCILLLTALCCSAAAAVCAAIVLDKLLIAFYMPCLKDFFSFFLSFVSSRVFFFSFQLCIADKKKKTKEIHLFSLLVYFIWHLFNANNAQLSTAQHSNNIYKQKEKR